MSQTRRHGPRSLVTCGKGIRHLTTLSEMIVPHFKFNIKTHNLNNNENIWHLVLKRKDSP